MKPLLQRKAWPPLAISYVISLASAPPYVDADGREYARWSHQEIANKFNRSRMRGICCMNEITAGQVLRVIEWFGGKDARRARRGGQRPNRLRNMKVSKPEAAVTFKVAP